jgi:hypothetical protein
MGVRGILAPGSRGGCRPIFAVTLGFDGGNVLLSEHSAQLAPMSRKPSRIRLPPAQQDMDGRTPQRFAERSVFFERLCDERDLFLFAE